MAAANAVVSRLKAASRSGTDRRLAAFAAAYVRFAADEPALFDVAFYAGLDKSRHPELAEAGEALLATLMPTALSVAEAEPGR